MAGYLSLYRCGELGRRVEAAEFHEAVTLARQAGLTRLDKVRPLFLVL